MLLKLFAAVALLLASFGGEGAWVNLPMTTVVSQPIVILGVAPLGEEATLVLFADGSALAFDTSGNVATGVLSDPTAEMANAAVLSGSSPFGPLQFDAPTTHVGISWTSQGREVTVSVPVISTTPAGQLKAVELMGELAGLLEKLYPRDKP